MVGDAVVGSIGETEGDADSGRDVGLEEVGETEGDAVSGRDVGLEVGWNVLGTLEDDDAWVGVAVDGEADSGSSLGMGSRVGRVDGSLVGRTLIDPGVRIGDEDACDASAPVGARVGLRVVGIAVFA